MTRHFLNTGLFVLALLTCAPAWAEYTLVLQNGRVIDPETGVDAVLNVGLKGDTIARITTEHLEGEQVIDVSNLVVAPGFIDLHSHTPTRLG